MTNRDFHAQITREKRGEINNIHNVVNNEMAEFNHGGCVHGSNALRVYMVVNAS